MLGSKVIGFIWQSLVVQSIILGILGPCPRWAGRSLPWETHWRRPKGRQEMALSATGRRGRWAAVVLPCWSGMICWYTKLCVYLLVFPFSSRWLSGY